ALARAASNCTALCQTLAYTSWSTSSASARSKRSRRQIPNSLLDVARYSVSKPLRLPLATSTNNSASSSLESTLGSSDEWGIQAPGDIEYSAETREARTQVAVRANGSQQLSRPHPR